MWLHNFKMEGHFQTLTLVALESLRLREELEQELVLTSKYLQVPIKQFSSIDTVGFNWLNSSDKIVSATIGGGLGAGLDLGGYQVYDSFEFDSNIGNDFDPSSRSFGDSFSDSWWNQ